MSDIQSSNKKYCYDCKVPLTDENTSQISGGEDDFFFYFVNNLKKPFFMAFYIIFFQVCLKNLKNQQ